MGTHIRLDVRVHGSDMSLQVGQTAELGIAVVTGVRSFFGMRDLVLHHLLHIGESLGTAGVRTVDLVV